MAGGFTVGASGSSDAESGLAGYTYPSLGSGWSNTGGAYSFTNSAGTQTGSVTAQNNAGLSSAGTSFTAQSDSAGADQLHHLQHDRLQRRLVHQQPGRDRHLR